MRQFFIVLVMVLMIPSVSIPQNTTYGSGAGAGLGTAYTPGVDNSFYGFNSGISDSTGSGNTALGAYAGAYSASVNGGIYLGYGAGRTNTTAHRLYIGTQYYPNSYIRGNLDTGLFGINMAPTRALDVSGSVGADSLIVPVIASNATHKIAVSDTVTFTKTLIIPATVPITKTTGAIYVQADTLWVYNGTAWRGVKLVATPIP